MADPTRFDQRHVRMAMSGGGLAPGSRTAHGRGAPERGMTTGPRRRATGGGSGGGRTSARLGVVDYTLAKRALLRDFRQGLLSKPDICDAHPELLRAGRYLGQEATRPCPVCEAWELRLLAYVFAEGLRANNGRAFEIPEAMALASGHRGGACYVVEVCLGCSWNHLSEAFLARPAG
jgi:hypothetical protein